MRGDPLFERLGDAGMTGTTEVITGYEARALVELLQAAESLARNANRMLDVHPKESRGSYYDDLKLAWVVALGAIARVRGGK